MCSQTKGSNRIEERSIEPVSIILLLEIGRETVRCKIAQGKFTGKDKRSERKKGKLTRKKLIKLWQRKIDDRIEVAETGANKNELADAFSLVRSFMCSGKTKADIINGIDRIEWSIAIKRDILSGDT